MDELARQKASTAQEYYDDYHEGFAHAPNTIFVGCVDNRITPELIIGKRPGEMVVIRVPGALVHAQGLGDAAVGGAIELALLGGTIEDIIVCGHTKCLMINTLATDADPLDTPNLARWAVMADFVRAQATTRADKHTQPARYKQALLEESIKRSLASLRELPAVRTLEDSGKLRVHGWYYDLENGTIVVYNEQDNSFSIVRADGTTQAPVVPDEEPVNPEAYVAAGVASHSVAPLSVEPAEVDNPSVEPATVAPDPVKVPRAEPVQRVYASEVTEAPRNDATGMTTQPPAREAEIIEPAPKPSIPSNVQEALDDPALDDIKQILASVRRPSGRLQVRETLNEINSRDGWLNVAKAVNEMRDPQVQQALREVAFELRSPQARAELRQIIADLDAGQLTEKLQNLNPQQIRDEFSQLIQQLRDEDK